MAQLLVYVSFREAVRPEEQWPVLVTKLLKPPVSQYTLLTQNYCLVDLAFIRITEDRRSELLAISHKLLHCEDENGSTPFCLSDVPFLNSSLFSGQGFHM